MKQILIVTIFIMTAVVFISCGNDNTQQPYLIGQKPADQKRVYTVSGQKVDSAVTIAEIEAETQKEIAKINKERDLELQKVEEDTKRIELKTQNELALKEHNLSTFVQEGDYALKKSTLIIIALSLTALFVLSFYIFKKRREDRLKMHQEELEKEMYLREKELQVKMAEKILDTIASGKLSKEDEQHLLSTLDKTNPGIAYKKNK